MTVSCKLDLFEDGLNVSVECVLLKTLFALITFCASNIIRRLTFGQYWLEYSQFLFVQLPQGLANRRDFGESKFGNSGLYLV
jgi:hypothetical protein